MSLNNSQSKRHELLKRFKQNNQISNNKQQTHQKTLTRQEPIDIQGSQNLSLSTNEFKERSQQHPTQPNGSTLKDLCPEEKKKIGDLILKLAEEKKQKGDLEKMNNELQLQLQRLSNQTRYDEKEQNQRLNESVNQSSFSELRTDNQISQTFAPENQNQGLKQFHVMKQRFEKIYDKLRTSIDQLDLIDKPSQNVTESDKPSASFMQEDEPQSEPQTYIRSMIGIRDLPQKENEDKDDILAQINVLKNSLEILKNSRTEEKQYPQELNHNLIKNDDHELIKLSNTKVLNSRMKQQEFCQVLDDSDDDDFQDKYMRINDKIKKSQQNTSYYSYLEPSIKLETHSEDFYNCPNNCRTTEVQNNQNKEEEEDELIYLFNSHDSQNRFQSQSYNNKISIEHLLFKSQEKSFFPGTLKKNVLKNEMSVLECQKNRSKLDLSINIQESKYIKSNLLEVINDLEYGSEGFDHKQGKDEDFSFNHTNVDVFEEIERDLDNIQHTTISNVNERRHILEDMSRLYYSYH